MMADKDCEQVVALLAPLCKKIITVTVLENARSISGEELAAMASRYCDNVIAAESYDHALELSKNDATVFISGSLYLAGAIREKVLERLD